VSVIVADTSAWIEFFGGRSGASLEQALAQGAVVVPPIVVAELVSGVRRARDRARLLDLLADLEVCDTPFDHWVRVGELRCRLAARGLSVSTPDAHVAQCALDRDAALLSMDAVFARVSRFEPLRLANA
jgi:tRNA(fMet)-specific endonuclease VapC